MVRIVSKKGKVYPNRAKNIVKKKAKTRLKYKNNTTFVILIGLFHQKSPLRNEPQV